MTTLHIEKDRSKLHTTHFTKFREAIEIKVSLLGILYVPGKIITGLCKLPELPYNMTTESDFPHLTLMVGETPPKMSTILLSTIFGKGGKFEGAYHDTCGILLSSGTFVDKLKIKLGKKNEEVFVVKGEKELELSGKTTVWYS